MRGYGRVLTGKLYYRVSERIDHVYPLFIVYKISAAVLIFLLCKMRFNARLTVNYRPSGKGPDSEVERLDKAIGRTLTTWYYNSHVKYGRWDSKVLWIFFIVPDQHFFSRKDVLESAIKQFPQVLESKHVLFLFVASTANKTHPACDI